MRELWPFLLLLIVPCIIVAIHRHRVFGYCDCCERWFVYPKTRRQMTAYEDDSQNFIHCCERCFDERQASWAEAWWEYWSGVL